MMSMTLSWIVLERYCSLGRNESPAGLTVLAHLPLRSSLASLAVREALELNHQPPGSYGFLPL